MERLPTDGWCSIPGVGRMSLVWPWYSVPDPQPLVDSHGRGVGVAPTVELHAPRSDRDVVLIIWSEAGGGFVVGPEWAASLARLYPGATVQANLAIGLSGAMGRLVRIAHGRETTWRILVPRERCVIHLETSVPTSSADAYWTQVETMLATWGWDA